MSQDCKEERFSVDHQANLVPALLTAHIHTHFGESTLSPTFRRRGGVLAG